MSFLKAIRQFKPSKLKDVTTVERQKIVVEATNFGKPSGGNKKGKFQWHMGHSNSRDLIEWFDEPACFRKKCEQLSSLIKKTKKKGGKIIVYTGAGISTSAKLPDYRGENGMWTNRDAGSDWKHQKQQYVPNITAANPTFAHHALTFLIEQGVVDYIISTNVDGLHLRSGTSRNNLAELHGNSYLEICQKCGKRYFRDMDVLQRQTEENRHVNRHWCGGICEQPDCGGLLMDTIVAFGENLPQEELEKAIRASEEGDLAIVLGSTMMVQPACNLPNYVLEKSHGKLVICNLQTTPFDDISSLNIRGHIDDVMSLLVTSLYPQWPSALPFQRTESFLDQKHLAKREDIQKRLVEIRRQEKNNEPTGNRLTRGENIYQRQELRGKKNVKGEIALNSVELLFIQDCTDCEFVINSKTKKIVLLNCQRLQLSVSATVLTSTMEIIKCADVSVSLNISVGTIQCDDSREVFLSFPRSKDDMTLIAWCRVIQPRLWIEGHKILDGGFPEFNQTDLSTCQIMSHKDCAGSVLHSITQRDDKGRISHLLK